MNVISKMDIRIRPGQGDVAVKRFNELQVFQECARAIPGFVQGRLMSGQKEPDHISVVAEWTDEQSYFAWTRHAVRQSQERDLAPFLAEAPITLLMHVRGSWVSDRPGMPPLMQGEA